MQNEAFNNVQCPMLSPPQRLENLILCLEEYKSGRLAPPQQAHYVNNHIHTIYSFSPYSPAGAALAAWQNGLTTAGIMDHDSVAGAEEFIKAGQILDIATTVGFECRCSFKGTPFEGKRLNNPDQNSVAYVACHGIPHQNIKKAQNWLLPYKNKRNERNRKMLDNINTLLDGSGISVDFEDDVLPLSQNFSGGSVTERHLLYALALKVCAVLGKGEPVLDFLKNTLGLNPDGKNLDVLKNADTEGYEYALLNVFKGNLVEKFYVEADEECPHVSEFIRFAKEIGAIPAYAYLGDVGSSVTGDKKAQTFEDAFLDELAEYLAKTGFLSITYMPTRNTPQQLSRLMALCDKHGLFQISGEDINSPSQSFICKALDLPEYKHLIESTWALIGHEKAATNAIEDGMFSEKSIAQTPCLQQRIEKFAEIGRKK